MKKLYYNKKSEKINRLVLVEKKKSNSKKYYS